jgi:putative two-component system response regulator
LAILAGETVENEPARILIVDDEEEICDILCRWLESAGYRCEAASHGDAALKMLEQQKFDLMVTDIMMPGMSGVDLVTITKTLFSDMAVIIVTAVDDPPTATTTLELGAYGYVVKPFQREEILTMTANALHCRRVSTLSQRRGRDLIFKACDEPEDALQTEEEIIVRLVSATALRSGETQGHLRRMGLYSFELAKSLGWSSERAKQIRLAAPMHDIGIAALPDGVLRKPGRYNEEEFEVIKTHPEIGARLLGGSRLPMMQMASDIAYAHHERWDGSGYPRGLSGEDIAESARIVAVADVYDSLVHPQPYRPALEEEDAVSIMMAAGRAHFGPRVFDCFMDRLNVMNGIRVQVIDE